jgi:hypothetical protein
VIGPNPVGNRSFDPVLEPAQTRESCLLGSTAEAFDSAQSFRAQGHHSLCGAPGDYQQERRPVGPADERPCSCTQLPGTAFPKPRVAGSGTVWCRVSV